MKNDLLDPCGPAIINFDMSSAKDASDVSGVNEDMTLIVELGPEHWTEPNEYADGDLCDYTNVGRGHMKHVALANFNYGTRGEKRNFQS